MAVLNKPKVIVGLSGGVDSSVAAWCLLQQGYEVEGLFMKNWEDDDTREYCSSEQDLKDVRAVAKTLGIPVHTINFAQEYWQRVFSYFLDELQQGRTPNPDVLCNREIKFKEFLQHALKLGADFIATGHYAGIQTTQKNGECVYAMTEAADTNKDQTYFLYTLGQEQLKRSLFPLADLTKPEIRAIAQEQGLITHNKKDSTGICFIGERNFSDFINDYLTGKPGDIKTPEGQQVGKHHGLMFYTLGQRKGLNIGGVKGAQASPWYVVAKDMNHNTLVVSQDKTHPMALSTHVAIQDLHWVDGQPPIGVELEGRVRYRQPKQRCRLQKTDTGFEVKFNEPQFAVTPGQALVLYYQGKCLGGATISSTDSVGGLILSRQEPLSVRESQDHAYT